MIRILLGQRGRLLRGVLATALSREQDLAVVAEVARGEEMLTAFARERPHLAVLDFGLPGAVLASDVARTLCRGVPVLVLIDVHACAAAGRALAPLAPRIGLLSTESSPAELLDSVRRLVRGEPVLDSALAVAALTADENPLTAREAEVLRMAVGGAPAKEIATALCLSAGTVRNYLSRILTKTGARTHIEAVRIAQEAGWI